MQEIFHALQGKAASVKRALDSNPLYGMKGLLNPGEWLSILPRLQI